MRAGQLIAAIGELYADLHGRGLWDANDAELSGFSIKSAPLWIHRACRFSGKWRADLMANPDLTEGDITNPVRHSCRIVASGVEFSAKIESFCGVGRVYNNVGCGISFMARSINAGQIVIAIFR